MIKVFIIIAILSLSGCYCQKCNDPYSCELYEKQAAESYEKWQNAPIGSDQRLMWGMQYMKDTRSKHRRIQYEREDGGKR